MLNFKAITRTSLMALAAATIGVQAQAFNSILDNGNVLKNGTHRVQLNAQGIFNEFEGVNVAGRFSTSITDDSEIQFEMGTGAVDFNAGVFAKYIPFPDTNDQPAVGVRLGYTYGKDSDDSISKFHIQPLISKNFETQNGRFVPYVVVPFSVTTYKNDSFVPMQVVVGSEWQPSNLKKVRFMAEYGMNAIRAYNYIGISAAVDFDGTSFVIE